MLNFNFVVFIAAGKLNGLVVRNLKINLLMWAFPPSPTNQTFPVISIVVSQIFDAKLCVTGFSVDCYPDSEAGSLWVLKIRITLKCFKVNFGFRKVRDWPEQRQDCKLDSLRGVAAGRRRDVEHYGRISAYSRVTVCTHALIYRF